jgi:hypothetical protein
MLDLPIQFAIALELLSYPLPRFPPLPDSDSSPTVHSDLTRETQPTKSLMFFFFFFHKINSSSNITTTSLSVNPDPAGHQACMAENKKIK